MVTRWRVCWLSAAILLSLTALVSGQCPAPMLNKFSYGDIQPDVSGSLFSVGSVLKVQCVPGFKSIGFTTFNCQSNGKWSPVAFPTCSVLFCGKPSGTLTNGYFTGRYEFNSTITYTCDPGYTLVGAVERHCRANQTWSGTTPTCRKTVCPSSSWVPYAGNCYYFGNESLAYSAARAKCQATPGADLVSILTNAEADFITSNLQQQNYTVERQLWIGLTDTDDDGGYEWYETSAVLDFANWDCGQPGAGSSAYNCGTVYAGSSKVGRWGDSSCSGAIGGYICKYGTAPVVRLVRSDCPYGWYALENKCFKFEMTAPAQNWADANKMCKSKYNGTLMSASDPKQMALFLTYINQFYPLTSKAVWMGLRQVQNEHSPWTWTDLTCSKYANWGCGEPNNAGWQGEDCMSIGFGKTNRNAGRWNDANCNDRKQYACEIPFSFKTLSSVSNPTCDETGIKCPAGWLQNGRSCYYIETNDRENWPGAVNRCNAKNGASLLSISDPNEQAFITSAVTNLGLTSEKKLWIGMNKDVSYSRFTWPDGTVALYRNWDCEFIKGSSSWSRSCAYLFAGARASGRRDGYWGADYCSSWSSSYNKDGYICESTIPQAVAPKFNQGICESGWIQSGRTCLYPATKSSDKLGWFSARAECQKLGGDLAITKTKEENAFVLDYIAANEPTFDQPIWIGLFVQYPVGTANNQTFYWVDNSTLTSYPYRHWGCGEPNNYGGKEHCGVIGIGPGNEMSSLWNDDGCDKKFNYLCSKAAPKVSPCKDGWLWNKESSSCYYVETNRTVNFTMAMSDCAAMGAMMVTVLDATEQNFLTSSLLKMNIPPGMNLWIGLNDSDANKVYAWNDGTRPFYNNFQCGQPGNGGVRACATMYAGGKDTGLWIDFDCGTNLGYICKTPGPGLKQLYPLVKGKCPTGWYQYRNECYWFEFTQQKSYTSAQTDCKTLNSNATLAIIPDDGVLDFFLHYMYQTYPTSSKNMYVGLRKARDFSAFEWEDGSCNKYTRWGCGEPNNWGNGENCGVFGVGDTNHNSAKINDDGCNKNQHFVCQMPVPGTTVPPPQCNVQPCEPGWAYYRGSCYYINVGTGTVNFDDASNWCLANRAELASVTDNDVNDFLATQLRSYRLKSGSSLWIGWRRDESTWPDGTRTLFRNWECGFAASASQWSRNCGFMFGGGSSTVLGKWGYDNCYSWIKKDGYICQRRTPKTKAIDYYPKSTQGVCEKGWVEMGNMCYLFKYATTDKTNHAGALRNCIAQGGLLASLSTKAQNTMFMKYMMSQQSTFQNPIWFGLYQKTPTDPFRWEDGSKLTYTNWGCGEPNNYGGSEDCGLISMGTGSFLSSMWNDDRCSSSYNYFCQKAKPSTHPCPPGFFQNHGSCYYFALNAKVTRAAAQTACVGLKSNLVTIRDRVEQYFLESIVGNLGSQYISTPQRYWIGLGDSDSDNIYTWMDGSNAFYKNWKCGSPSSGGRMACVTMENSNTSTTGRWDDSDCSTTQNGYICETYISGSEQYLSTVQGGCGAGWVENDGMCYQFNMETADKSTYKEADKQCTNTNSQLLTVHNDNTHQFITHYITQKKSNFDGAVWLSLTKLQGNRYSAFHWKDGKCLNYQQWGCNEPNDYGSGENCGVIGIGGPNDNSGTWNDDGCSKSFNYICEKPMPVNTTGLNTSVVLPPPPTGPSSPTCSYSVQCPAGWMKYGESCFWATTNTKVSFSTAAKDCQLRGGSLVSAADATQQTLLRTFMSKLNVTGSKKLWIGLNDYDYSGSYIWPDGSPGFYRYWDCSKRGSGKCIYADSSTGRWGRTFCSSTSNDGYVCQWSTAKKQFTPQTFEQGICPSGWYQRNHLCYKFETTKKTNHAGALAACRAINGTLVTVDSSTVQSYINHYFLQKEPTYNDAAWIGVHQATRHAPWLWADGSNTSSYTNWGCGEPNDAGGSGEDCGIVGYGENNDNSGLWNDDSCTNKQANYICQQPVPQLTPCFYGWEYNAASDACVMINSMQNLTFSQAETMCKTAWPGADLASIEDPQENDFVVGLIKAKKLPTNSQLWIGLTDTDKDKYYTWQNGQRNQFSNFDCDIYWWSGRKPCVYANEMGVWTPQDCSSKTTGFICKYSVPKADKTDMYKLDQGNCNAGYYEFRGLCWLFQDTNVYDFDTSQTDCMSKGGNLAAIRDAYDSSFIVRYRAEKFPLNKHTQVTIGYKKSSNLFGQFRWQDKSCPNYNSWGCGEPNNAGSNGEPCAQYQFGGETGSVGFTGKWNDYDCKAKTNYICQVPLPNITTPSTLCAAIKCQPGWVSWRGNCYKFVANDSANWPSAYEKCLKMNSALLSISDFTEEAWVTQQLKKFNFPAEKKLWIGLNDQKYQVYRWPDDTTAFYRNWDCDAYANWAKQCVYIFAGFRKVGTQRTGKWGPDSCSSWGTSYNKDGYICESSPASAMGNVPIYTQGNCDPGWAWFQNRCYYFSQDKVDFPTAQGKCSVFNARLGVINTQAKNNFVVDYMIGNWSDFTGSRFWIGLHQAKPTDPFTWVNKTEPVVYTNYHCGEPNDAGGKEDCIEFVISNDFSNSASWNDVQCTSSAHYICDKVAPPPTTMPTTIPPTTTVPTTTPRPTTTAMPTTRAPTTTPGTTQPPTTPGPTTTSPESIAPTTEFILTTTPPTEEPGSFGNPILWNSTIFELWLLEHGFIKYYPKLRASGRTAGEIMKMSIADLSFLIEDRDAAEALSNALKSEVPTIPGQTKPPTEESGGLSSGAMAAIIVVALAVILGLVLLLVFVRGRRTKDGPGVGYSKQDDSILVKSGDMSATNPAFENPDYAEAIKYGNTVQ
eukprot:scpid2705/ scgid1303/ Macrophage mannose receptor 1